MPEPVEWVRGDGQRRYQPCTSDGLRLWMDWTTAWMVGDAPDWRWGTSRAESADPVTYRSKARARRVAARKERRDKKKQMKEMREVNHADA